MVLNKIGSLFVVLVLIFSSCKDDKAEIEPQKNLRTFLIYMAADNNLSDDSYQNISSIIQGAGGYLDEGRLLVYQDPRDDKPQLIEIYQEGREVKSKVVKSYPEHNSAAAEVLSLVINDAFSMYETESRGLMLWSHGTSWLPEDKRLWSRSFGQDRYDEMELSELKQALPDSFFDFIIFDACLMSSIEVCYELKDKAEYIVASPVEIFAEGFPYKLIIKDIFSKQQTEEFLTSICNTFYSYYSENEYYYNAASISIIKTAGLDELALLCKQIVKGKIGEIHNINTDNIQGMYFLTYGGRKLLFDFKDFYDQIATNDQKAEMSRSLDEVVVLQKSTSMVYSSNLLYAGVRDGLFSVTKNSGLSTYIPQTQRMDLNTWYSDLDWGKVVYSTAD